MSVLSIKVQLIDKHLKQDIEFFFTLSCCFCFIHALSYIQAFPFSDMAVVQVH